MSSRPNRGGKPPYQRNQQQQRNQQNQPNQQQNQQQDFGPARRGGSSRGGHHQGGQRGGYQGHQSGGPRGGRRINIEITGYPSSMTFDDLKNLLKAYGFDPATNVGVVSGPLGHTLIVGFPSSTSMLVELVCSSKRPSVIVSSKVSMGNHSIRPEPRSPPFDWCSSHRQNLSFPMR